MFFYYVNKVFPVTNPSFDGVKFTSELNLADIDCMKQIEPTFDLIYPEDKFEQLQDAWIDLIGRDICQQSPIKWDDFIKMNDQLPSNV